MFDYLSLQNSSENPTLSIILLTTLLCFLLSSLISYTYQKTTRDVKIPLEFLQSLVLLSIVSATVMQAIGDSLARGLGMLGALAIIRFRTSLRTPRNMAFTFSSLAVGISCGVYAFVIAIVGTLGFCITAFVLRMSPGSKKTNPLGILKFELPATSDDISIIEDILKNYCEKYAQVRYEINTQKIKKTNEGKETISVLSLKQVKFEYHLKLKETVLGRDLDGVLSNLPEIQSIKLHFENIQEKV